MFVRLDDGFIFLLQYFRKNEFRKSRDIILGHHLTSFSEASCSITLPSSISVAYVITILVLPHPHLWEKVLKKSPLAIRLKRS